MVYFLQIHVEKKQIEDLSNLVFGLALTLGALSLVAPKSDDSAALLGVLLLFALSFTILVYIWWLYNTAIKELEIKGSVFVLNIVLLFFVVIEPYLLTIIDTRAGATAYAIDVASVLLILAYFVSIALKKSSMKLPQQDIHWMALRRNLLLLTSALFFLSIIPILILTNPQGENFATTIWFITLLIALLSRSVFIRK